MYEKYNFTTDLQDAILACTVAHPEKFIPYQGTMNTAYFTGVQRIAAARAIFSYWRKNSRFPSWDVLADVVYDAIARTADEKEEETILGYVKKLREMDTGDADYVASKVIQFAKERALYLAINESAASFQAGEVPANGFIPMFEEAMKVGNNLTDMGYIIGPKDNDIEKIVTEYTAEGYAISTGYEKLDSVCPAGGFEPGWLVAVLAPPKRYKTTFCINLAMNIVRGAIARPVFYYPCEITQKLAGIRTLCNLTGMTIASIRKNPKAFTESALAEAQDKLGANLLIKGYPSRAATIAGDIRTHAMNSRQQLGMNPGAIVIDFAETVKSSSDMKRTSEHRAQGEIYIEARALAAEMNCPVILPDRCNKETVGRAVPSMKSFQGSFEKAGIVDLAIGLCSSEQEYMQNIIRFFVFLNRHGEANQHFRGTVVPERMQMTIDDKIPWNPEDDDYQENRAGRGRGQRRVNPPPPERIDEG